VIELAVISIRGTLGVAIAAVLGLLGTACTAVPSNQRDVRDPFERVNRATFAFNDRLDRAVAHPVARAYRRALPQFARIGISNFFSNASYPTVIVNDALQGKFGSAGRDTGRLLLNTTVGIVGLFDPATPVGLPQNNEDFGQTLGTWGLAPGAYLTIPLLGPSSVRDSVGLLVDQFTEPRQYLRNANVRWALWAGKNLERRARLLDADTILDRTGDKYAFLRSVYFQRREYLVRDGNVQEEQPPE
jgi:phospholipid-binding lipoprotein MlaA